MAYLNNCRFIGNLGQDPVVRQTKDGKDIANISVGITESWKDKNTGERQSKTEWLKVTLFGGAATFTKNYLKKGNLVYIEGCLQTRKYTDKDGIEKYTTEIIVQNMKGQIQNLSSKEKTATDKVWDKVEDALNKVSEDDLNDEIPF